MHAQRSPHTNGALKVSLVAVAVVVGVSVTVAVGVLSHQQSAQAQDASVAPSYTVTDLGTLGSFNSNANGINEAGQVVGFASADDNNPAVEHAFLYDESTSPKMTDLGTLGGRQSIAYGINEAGQVVGWANTSSEELHAFLYSGGQMVDLGTLGGTYSGANGINDAGQVVGDAYTSSQEVHAFLYDANATPKMVDLGTLGGTYSWAEDINEAGQVVGRVQTSSGAQHAFLYSEGQMVDLNNLIPPDSGWTLRGAQAINNMGQIVGYGTYNGDFRAFLLTPKKYSFGGFFSPVDNPPTLNVLKAGWAVPVKFSLGGDEGLDIFAEGYPKSVQVECSSSAPLDAIERTVSARVSSLSYDATTDRYTYAWKTQKAWRGTCRQLVLQFDDGSVHRANFKFN